jgi:hypothetical protein
MSEDAPVENVIVDPANEADVAKRIKEQEVAVLAQATSLIPSAEESKNIAAAARLSTVNPGTVARIVGCIKIARSAGQRSCTSTAYDGVRKVLEIFRAQGYNVTERPHPNFEHGLLDFSW